MVTICRSDDHRLQVGFTLLQAGYIHLQVGCTQVGWSLIVDKKYKGRLDGHWSLFAGPIVIDCYRSDLHFCRSDICICMSDVHICRSDSHQFQVGYIHICRSDVHICRSVGHQLQVGFTLFQFRYIQYALICHGSVIGCRSDVHIQEVGWSHFVGWMVVGYMVSGHQLQVRYTHGRSNGHRLQVGCTQQLRCSLFVGQMVIA